MDLAQSTCVRAIEKAAGSQPGTRLDSWLFKMEHRLWSTALRAWSVRAGGGLQPVEDIDIPDPGPNAEMNIFIHQVLSTINQRP